jgi:TRAP-type C4-dicarboxylate transport system permease small subunit
MATMIMDWIPTPTLLVVTIALAYATFRVILQLASEFEKDKDKMAFLSCGGLVAVSIGLCLLSGAIWTIWWLWMQWPESLRFWSERLLLDRLIPAFLLMRIISQHIMVTFIQNGNTQHYTNTATVVNRQSRNNQ